jgi:N-acetylmuramoyl-L-alanine amidase
MLALAVASLVGLLPAAPARAAAVSAVRLTADTLEIRFDDRVAAASSVLLGPERRLALDVAGLEPGPVPAAAAVRAAPGGADATRLEFALPALRVVTGGRFADDGRVLTLALAPATAAAFARAAAQAPRDFFPWSLGERAARARPLVSVAVPPAKRLPLPRVTGDETRPLVVIDAGHGGVDPGAINPDTGLREKDVTLAIAKAIRDELVRSGRARVALTRSDDRFLVLRERFGIARRLRADLFISIHCDSVGQGDASGASAYTLSEVASDREAARLAARENKADVIAGVNLGGEDRAVSSILIDLTQRETMNASAGFARLLGRESAGLIAVKPTFHRMASLMVLKAPDMPSVLFETGYISNARDAAFLDSADGRERIAQGVRRAVEVHFARRMAAR